MKVKVAAIQAKEQGSYQANLDYHIAEIIKAAQNGAQIICTQELFLSNYFCREQNTTHFKLAEKIPGNSSHTLSQIAKEHKIVIIASLFEEAMPGLYYNTTIVIDADGTLLGKYRKNHIPQDPYFEEKFYFTPGDTGFPVWNSAYGKIGVIICWDQWYPESARLLALKGAEIIFVPTAIGWLPDEKEQLGKQQHHSWQCVQQGHAIANACYYVAVNRTGCEEPIEFWGHSFISNFYGQNIAQASSDQAETITAECDLEALKEHRQIWPFFRDRRIDCYDDLSSRGGEA